MTPNLTKYVGKTILVSIPVLSEDSTCRPYRLNGIELMGLWLESDDLPQGFLTAEDRSHAQLRWSFFVPFTQIACVAISLPATKTAPAYALAGQEEASAQSAPRDSPSGIDMRSIGGATVARKAKSK